MSDESANHERTQGIERIVKFIERTIGKNRLVDTGFFLDLLANNSLDEDIALLSRCNGLILQTPQQERGLFLASTTIERGLDLQYHPPEQTDSIEILRQTLTALQALAGTQDPTRANRIARTLFNLVIYLHPFLDGNGRTARLLYFLFSDSIKKQPEQAKDQLSSVLQNRASRIKDYHELLNTTVYEDLLQRRNIPTNHDPLNKNDRKPIARLESFYITQNSGFDSNCLGYLALNDCMTSEQREQYGEQLFQDVLVRIYDIDQLPQELVDAYQTKLPAIRKEFVRRLLERSLSQQEWPDECNRLLQQVFGLEN